MALGAGPDKLRASFQVPCAAPRHGSTSRSAPDAWAVNSVTSPDPLRQDLCALLPCLLAFSFLFLDFFSLESTTLNFHCRISVDRGKGSWRCVLIASGRLTCCGWAPSTTGGPHVCAQAQKIPIGFDAAAPPQSPCFPSWIFSVHDPVYRTLEERRFDRGWKPKKRILSYFLLKQKSAVFHWSSKFRLLQ